MPESWPWIVGGALLLLWTVGAYNRLVRLRAEVARQWAPLDAALRRRHGLAQDGLPTAAAEASPPALPPDLAARLAAAAAAARQAGRAAAAALAKPLAGGEIRTLSLAEQVLDRSLALLRENAQDAATPPDGSLQAMLHTLHQAALQVEFTRGAHDDAVARYNAAVAEWPTCFVAWLFHFGAGGALSPGVACEPVLRPGAAPAPARPAGG